MYNLIYNGDNNTYFLKGNNLSNIYIRVVSDDQDEGQSIEYNFGNGVVAKYLTPSEQFINSALQEEQQIQTYINESRIPTGEYLFIDETAPPEQEKRYKVRRYPNEEEIYLIPLTINLDIKNGGSTQVRYILIDEVFNREENNFQPYNYQEIPIENPKLFSFSGMN